MAAALLALALVTGCGGGGGAASGATVSVYVAAPLCAGARRALARERGRAAALRVHAVCLRAERRGRRLDLATIGANARRATGDSAAVAYLEPHDPAANRFTEPILEAAAVGWTTASSGAAAMNRVLHAIAGADTGALRESVRNALGGS